MDVIKHFWIALLAITVIGLIISMPVEKTHKSYQKELNKIQEMPQKRLDATERFVDAIHDGTEDLSQGLRMDPPRKYYVDSEDEEFYKMTKSSLSQKYSSHGHSPKSGVKPRYKRDKNNPKVLYRVNQ